MCVCGGGILLRPKPVSGQPAVELLRLLYQPWHQTPWRLLISISHVEGTQTTEILSTIVSQSTGYDPPPTRNFQKLEPRLLVGVDTSQPPRSDRSSTVPVS